MATVSIPNYWERSTERPYNKRQAIDDGIALCKAFCKANGLPPISVNVIDQPWAALKAKRFYGEYDPNVGSVRIFLKTCAVPSSSGYAWSWPGYKADLTPIGVIAHEVGHHWHYTRKEGVRDVMRDFRRAVGDSALTSYGATSIGESIAESFKVLITNPTLLKLMRPSHYAWFTIARSLKPVVTVDWSTILAGSERHISVVRDRAALLVAGGAE